METDSSSFVGIKLIKARPDAADNICGLESSECFRRLQISDQNLLSVTPMQTTLLKPRVLKEAKGLRQEPTDQSSSSAARPAGEQQRHPCSPCHRRCWTLG